MSDSSRPAEERPRMSSGRAMFRTHSERYPLDLFSYTREAGYCLDESRFLAAVAMASSAVELILNRDRRLRALPGFQGSYGWASLNNRNLRIARDNGLPVNALLSAGDNLDSNQPIAFVELRNKVAHGEITHLINDLSDYDPDAAKLAAEQDGKMRQFVSEWYTLLQMFRKDIFAITAGLDVGVSCSLCSPVLQARKDGPDQSAAVAET